MNLDAQAQQRKQHALYNYSNKYTNVKSEMAAAFVKELVAEKANAEPGIKTESLASTLKELFSTFFPEKVFLGPTPKADGSLEFPVRTMDKSIHDLNDLSAGEKEILFGYLRMRNSAPKYSVILIDEPELHLNPRLVRGLPQFYDKNLGKALTNQIWLVTHSDALLREVIGNDEFSLFHMTSTSSVPEGTSQVRSLVASEDIERAVLNLVGDLASYRPGGKVLVFEGGGDSEFDQEMALALFPQLAEVNCIAGENKARVQHLHDILQKAANRGKLPIKIFSITDRDSSHVPPKNAGSYQWNVYHIENYLLEPETILHVLTSLGVKTFTATSQVYEALRECARETLNDLLRHALGSRVNESLVSAIKTGTSPEAEEISSELRKAAERSLERVSVAMSSTLTLDNLRKAEDELRTKLEYELSGDDWRINFRGRDILRRFSGKHVQGIPYESFRNLVISRMRDLGYQPPGMASVIEKITLE